MTVMTPGGNLLIAEDEARIASFIQKGLRSAGFTPTVVGDGRAAFDYAMTGDFDLLVLDIGLPVLDGFAVLRKLRQARNEIPVVILTARDSISDTVAMLDQRVEPSAVVSSQPHFTRELPASMARIMRSSPKPRGRS